MRGGKDGMKKLFSLLYYCSTTLQGDDGYDTSSTRFFSDWETHSMDKVHVVMNRR